MRNLDRFYGVMTYGEFDHPPLLGEGAWGDTMARWQREGLEEGKSWADYFGVKCFDIDGHGFDVDPGQPALRSLAEGLSP